VGRKFERLVREGASVADLPEVEESREKFWALLDLFRKEKGLSAASNPL
jgi:hypothetical protein